MSARTVLAVASVLLGLAVSQAFAEGEGNGEPFVTNASAQVTGGHPFVVDSGSAAYPDVTGDTAQPSGLASLEPAFGSEAAVQTANSLPNGSGSGTAPMAKAKADLSTDVGVAQVKH